MRGTDHGAATFRHTEPMNAEVVRPCLVPELTVTDIEVSREFWCSLLGFVVKYDRPEEGFAYLTLGTAHLMLDQAGLGRTWSTGLLARPFGRGVNFEIAVDSVKPVLQRLSNAKWPLFAEPEEKRYGVGDRKVGVIQFLVQDPDGYLVRLSQPLDQRGPGT